MSEQNSNHEAPKVFVRIVVRDNEDRLRALKELAEAFSVVQAEIVSASEVAERQKQGKRWAVDYQE